MYYQSTKIANEISKFKKSALLIILKFIIEIVFLKKIFNTGCIINNPCKICLQPIKYQCNILFRILFFGQFLLLKFDFPNYGKEFLGFV